MGSRCFPFLILGEVCEVVACLLVLVLVLVLVPVLRFFTPWSCCRGSLSAMPMLAIKPRGVESGAGVCPATSREKGVAPRLATERFACLLVATVSLQGQVSPGQGTLLTCIYSQICGSFSFVAGLIVCLQGVGNTNSNIYW